LSGSWPGELFFSKGGPKRTFAAPVKLKNKDGKTINIGGGIRDRDGDMLLIAGDATFEQKDGKTFILYEGEKIEVQKGKQAGITGTASAVHAFDWDGDGDLDLLVGDIGGSVYLVPNEGTAKAYSFGKEQPLQAGGKAIRVSGDAGPFVADWDGDGRADLLVGAGDGAVTLFRNVGKGKAAELAAGETLVEAGQATYGAGAPKDPRRGVRSKVCVADWNGDGRLDLLLGDFATQKPNRPEPTPAEKVEQDKARKELEAVRSKYGELVQKLHGPGRAKEQAELDKVEKEFRKVAEQMTKLQAMVPPEYENHGWVWLFLRKPAEAKR
jgi:hypothetical protein